MVCFNKIVYNSSHTSAEVEAVCRQHSSITKMEYNWNNEGYSSSNKYAAGNALAGALSLTVRATDGDGTEFTISPEAPNFMWQNPTIT